MFDFQLGNDVQLTNTSKRRLSPWEIHKVTFTNIETVEVNGKADPSVVYKMIRLRFENDEGYYEESIFYPTESDSERRKFQNSDGTEREVPSNWERTKMFIYVSLNALNPEGLKKFQTASSKFKNFEMMAKAYITVMTEAIGKECEIKLGGRNQKDGNVIPVFPSFINIGKNKEIYVSSNIIGENLYFTPYEERQRSAFKNAKPTVMPDLNLDVSNSVQESNDSMKVDDIADLLADLQ